MRKAVIAAAALSLVALGAAPANAVDKVNSKRLRDAVTVNGILGHERVLQRIAGQHGGTRASGTSGYAASAAYVRDTLAAAGYRVSEQEFTFPFFRELAPPTLAQLAPAPAGYATRTFDFSGSGDVTGTVVPTTDVQVPAPATPGVTSGCEAADFTPAGAAPAVALIQRGSCTFGTKVSNAVAAGYDAVVIFNEGQPGRTDLLSGDLGKVFGIPVVGLSYADGAALVTATQAGAVTARVTTSTFADETAKTSNVFAETPGGDPDKVLVVGAHLDSVIEGPGINDNGSGVATNLEIAEQLAALKVRPRQKIRFAFWGAEEAGLLGSEHYVATLPGADLARIFANLNFDMLGSPNYVRFVYDGDGSQTPVSGPPGSGEIERVFTDYFAGQGLATEPREFNGRSDYGPFIAVGIPAGGIFSGAEGKKTEAQATVYGGTAGAAYDACYHQACDTINNLNPKALAELSDAAAHAVYTLAMTRTGFFPDGSLRATAARSMPKARHGMHPAR
ncbi:Zn-dependent M28 family amino/carboxypeptidase [Krasilnikovia cinnamomea]|uniref:Zn-dependent M28 family amino/carboxypeptidase n=1 Tax=Krasilnikovia cinnamomea TaxID=349313 RepID=A0A4Q7ZUH0_9ACTN|nr:M28 family metallopeptidase [Krasilnikovia cinnamomea]RZU54229.1 Zn-dependent M28 family amino/carboxypeptidase [Krasilnikovia cinnamomea]